MLLFTWVMCQTFNSLVFVQTKQSNMLINEWALEAMGPVNFVTWGQRPAAASLFTVITPN